MISASQIRAARALLGIDQKSLAERAGISLSAIQRMEAGESDLPGAFD
ncbi:XRE family transcriptional regulator, partial [Mesorhizobium sp. M2D.F.Ca.ET.145.01.1.1]